MSDTSILDWPRLTKGERKGAPRIRLQSELIEYWCLRITASNSELEQWESADASSLHTHLDSISHYAMELGRIIRKANGRPRLVLLNGDTYNGASGWGTSTSHHQADLRRQVEQAVEGTNIGCLVVPFSALEAAGIDFDSIRVVEALPDRHTYHEMSSDERPGDPVLVESGETEMVPYNVVNPYHSRGYQIDGKRVPHDTEGATYGEITELVERPILVPSETKAHVKNSGMAHGWADGYAELQSDGKWHWTVKRHWLGESLFRATVTETRRRKLTADEQAEVDAWNAARAPEREADEAVRKLYDERAGINWRRRRLPEGYDLSTEDAARMAELEPLIEAAEDTLRKAQFELAKYSLPDGLSANQIVYYIKRTSYYLSAFDYEEPHRPYFMCELPRSIVRDGQRVQVRPKTVAEALDDLMPDEVRQAIASGLEVIRQGDVFAIPTSCTTKELESRAVSVERTRYVENDEGQIVPERHMVKLRSKAKGDADVLGTNHAPTHAILTTDGDWYGRGRMYHVPRQSWRQPDHRVKELGDRTTWFRLVKNTVPLDVKSGSSRGSMSATVFQSGDSRAWTLGGVVD